MLPYSDIVGQTSTSLLLQFQVWWPNECYSWKLPWIPRFHILMSLTAVSSLWFPHPCDFHTDPLLRSKTWLDPAVGRRERVVIRLERFCWSGKPFTSVFRNSCIYRSQSGSPAFALPQRRLLLVFSMCASISLVPHFPLARGALHSKESKIKSPWKDFYSAQTSLYA